MRGGRGDGGAENDDEDIGVDIVGCRTAHHCVHLVLVCIRLTFVGKLVVCLLSEASLGAVNSQPSLLLPVVISVWRACVCRSVFRTPPPKLVPPVFLGVWFWSVWWVWAFFVAVRSDVYLAFFCCPGFGCSRVARSSIAVAVCVCVLAHHCCSWASRLIMSPPPPFTCVLHLRLPSVHLFFSLFFLPFRARLRSEETGPQRRTN